MAKEQEADLNYALQLAAAVAKGNAILSQDQTLAMAKMLIDLWERPLVYL
jgi:hypothetical protein